MVVQAKQLIEDSEGLRGNLNVVDLTDTENQPIETKFKEILADLRLHGFQEDDMLVLDVLGECAWLEADVTQPLACPHLRKPAAPGPRRNKALAGVLRELHTYGKRTDCN